jgi:hypothetical protein
MAPIAVQNRGAFLVYTAVALTLPPTSSRLSGVYGEFFQATGRRLNLHRRERQLLLLFGSGCDSWTCVAGYADSEQLAEMKERTIRLLRLNHQAARTGSHVAVVTQCSSPPVWLRRADPASVQDSAVR